jgi:hypothetical protein
MPTSRGSRFTYNLAARRSVYPAKRVVAARFYKDLDPTIPLSGRPDGIHHLEFELHRGKRATRPSSFFLGTLEGVLGQGLYTGYFRGRTTNAG